MVSRRRQQEINRFLDREIARIKAGSTTEADWFGDPLADEFWQHIPHPSTLLLVPDDLEFSKADLER